MMIILCKATVFLLTCNRAVIFVISVSIKRNTGFDVFAYTGHGLVIRSIH